MKNYEELLALAEQLQTVAEKKEDPAFAKPLESLEHAIAKVGRCASGSWLGYQALVYYRNLQEPPLGAHFDKTWGLGGYASTMTQQGDWVEYPSHNIREYIQGLAGNPDLSIPHEIEKKAVSVLNEAKATALSIIEIELRGASDSFLEKVKSELDQLKPTDPGAMIRSMAPSGSIQSADRRALNGGIVVPPHLTEIAEILALKFNVGICKDAAELLRKAGSHLERKFRQNTKAARVGTNVFIGHGRSPIWRELKDFIEKRLQLPADEFNRVPIAGVTNIARLSEMLDAAAAAFIIMTGEDETADGEIQARMNVIHEVGLFQGRLGFTKAIVLLEEGCVQFSNIEGLGQLRFPKGKISAVFEEIRQIMERENLIKIE